MSTAIDLSQLSPPNVVEALDYEIVLAALKADVIARDPTLADALALESEPVTKLLEVFAYRELLLRSRINDAARAVLLATATGADLDQLAALTETQRLDAESDSSLRRRAQLAWEGLSTAGPEGAYRYHALSAHPEVRDATITSPTPGDVVVTLLSSAGDGTPGSDVIAAVETHLADADVRPLTDRVTVQAASITAYTIEAGLTIYPGPDQRVVRDAAVAAVEALAINLQSLGKDIIRSAIYAALHREGVHSVNLVEPDADIICDATEAAYCTGIIVEIEGTDT